MILLNVFKWIFEIPSSTNSGLQNLIIKTGAIDGNISATVIAILIVGVIFILITCIYALAAKKGRQNGTFATQQFPIFINSGQKRRTKRRKPKKSASKQRFTKAQKLREVNIKWSAMYCSENSDCEEAEDSAVIPFGSLEVTRTRKVSFRDSIQDVYFIESKEEMKRLEKLHDMGYDVTITRPTRSARGHTCQKATKIAVCEEKETVYTLATCSTIADNYSYKGEPDTSLRLLKKWQSDAEFQTEDSKTFNDENLIRNHIFKDEERLQMIP